MIEEREPLDSEAMEGRWNKEEHQRFLIGIMKYGKDWKNVEKVVKTRMASQVRSHAQKFFLKLHEITKERKKNKNKTLAEPSEIEREILELLSIEEVTMETPEEIIAVLQKVCNEVKSAFPERKKRFQNSQRKSPKKIRPDISTILSNKIESETSNDRIGQSSEDSYFIKTIKINKEHFLNGHSFDELMAFENNFKDQNNLEMQRKERRFSFCLFDDEENETKLKETLETFHRCLGSDL